MKDHLKIIAAVLCVAYILVQTFQWYVYDAIPETGNVTTDFLNAARSLHICRSVALLISMFGLIVIYATICRAAFRLQKMMALLAFLGFFIFFLLEIMLRSVELFYIQIALPKTYETAVPATRELIIQQVQQFYSIQLALYFPLIFSAWLASGTIIFIFRKSRGADMLLIIALLVNFIRMALRLAVMYLHADLLGDKLTNALYLPLVVVVFGLQAAWLLKTAGENKTML